MKDIRTESKMKILLTDIKNGVGKETHDKVHDALGDYNFIPTIGVKRAVEAVKKGGVKKLKNTYRANKVHGSTKAKNAGDKLSHDITVNRLVERLMEFSIPFKK